METSALQRYEKAFASWLGVEHAFGFWKGRVAFHAVLRALGIAKGDEVILPGYTCVMAVNPIIYLDAKPVFVDIESETFNIDPTKIEDKITARTKLIIAQHTYGYPADMDAIMEIARRRGLPVVEDCCLALGSKYNGRLTGTIGRAAYFSFQWNKPYTSGLGGMAVTSDPELASRINDLQQEAIAPRLTEVIMLRLQLAVYRTMIYPWTAAVGQSIFRILTRLGLVVGSSSSGEYTPVMADDFLKRMSNSQARSGLRQLGRIEQNLHHRRQMTHTYDELLQARGWAVPTLASTIEPALVRYPVRVADKDGALANASRHFVELGSWFECPLHPIETPMEACGYYSGMCPEAEQASREVVNLPVHPRTDAGTARRTVKFVGRIGPAETSSSSGATRRAIRTSHQWSEAQRREIDVLEESWYIPTRFTPRAGRWVYSLDFTLGMLQGCVTELHRVRRSPAWLVIGTLTRTLTAVTQVVIMILSRLPILSWFVEILARTFTRNPIGFFLRSCYWKARLRHLGRDTIIDQGVEIWGPENISIGSNCHIDTNVRLAAGERRHGQRGSITIGNFVHLGPGVHIAGRGGVSVGDFVGISANAHLYSASGVVELPSDPGRLASMSHMAPADMQHVVEAPITIEEYAFIGIMARVMPGVRVGRGAIVHANCELTRNVAPFANIGGAPRGRQIGWRRPRRRSPHLDPPRCDSDVESGEPEKNPS
ncbi:MAG: DegT/DnrJ/EryC1/StrS family aminotransferase [Phycisphaerae bacterium]